MTRGGMLLALCVMLMAPIGGGCGAMIVGTETEPGVVYLGERVVGFRVDRDVLGVGSDTGAFRKLRFVVRDAPIAVYNMHIEFGNGQVVDVPTRLEFRRGGESREIDLPGDQRYIKTVQFLYETLGRRQGRARVQIFGVR